MSVSSLRGEINGCGKEPSLERPGHGEGGCGQESGSELWETGDRGAAKLRVGVLMCYAGVAAREVSEVVVVEQREAAVLSIYTLCGAESSDYFNWGNSVV